MISFSFGTNGFEGQWDVSPIDMDTVVGGLDDNHDGILSAEETARHRQAQIDYLLARLHVRCDGVERKLRVKGVEFTEHSGETYFALPLELENPAQPELLEIEYRLFFDLNPKHRGIFVLNADGKQQTALFNAENPVQQFRLAKPSIRRQFATFCHEGIWHIWHGFDHILFLLALLLPSVVHRKDGKWQAVTGFRPACLSVLKIVTAFTVAHSITLTIATLGWAQLPSRLVESCIAGSIILAAANNLRPFFAERGWLVAFVFGLVHGFGFASGLKELGLAPGRLAVPLVGFNVGVETGQLAIVACFLPLAYVLRASWFYDRVILKFGSALIMLLAAFWMFQRLFG